MTLKIYYQRTHTTISSITLSNGTDMGKPDVPIAQHDFNGMPIYGFNLQEDTDEIHILATMLLPSFFSEMKGTEIHGLFLIPIGTQERAEFFLDDHRLGSFGCPKELKIFGNDGYFTFNNQRFYPFLMTDLTVGYYVRDDMNGPAPEWSGPADPETQVEVGVALDHPLTYDPTLGLYMTRGAHKVFKPKGSLTTQATREPAYASN